MTDDNVHLLAGAYALDALPVEERAFFERHLAACASCREEVAEYRETAARLGTASAETPPEGMRAAVLAQIDATRQVSPVESDRRRPDRWLQARLPAVAAALAIAVLILGGTSVYLLRDLAEPPGVPQEFIALADSVALEAPEGVEARFLYSHDHDEGWLVISGLDPLDAEHDYQLWLFHDGTPVPAGVFDADARGHVTVQAQAQVTAAELVAVTVEPAGGLPEPSGAVLLSGEL